MIRTKRDPVFSRPFGTTMPWSCQETDHAMSQKKLNMAIVKKTAQKPSETPTANNSLCLVEMVKWPFGKEKWPTQRLGIKFGHGWVITWQWIFECHQPLTSLSKNFSTHPWNIPQTPNQRFMKEFLSFGGLGIPGVCSKGMLGFS